MPTVFRSMRKADDGFPVVGRSTSSLGVRVIGMIPPAQKVDVDTATNNDVIVNEKGMSVNRTWRDISPNFLPIRCGGFASNNRYCFRMGEGAFVKGPFSDGLEFFPDTQKHGLVRPARIMPLAQYEDYLAATRVEWQIDEN